MFIVEINDGDASFENVHEGTIQHPIAPAGRQQLPEPCEETMDSDLAEQKRSDASEPLHLDMLRFTYLIGFKAKKTKKQKENLHNSMPMP